MKYKIDSKTEQIFSYAVALNQNSQMKNAVYCGNRDVYILNFDNTILLKFRLGKNQSFSQPVAFYANDYDSNLIQKEGDKIVFLTVTRGYERRKVCVSPKLTFEDVNLAWKRLMGIKREKENRRVKVEFPKSVIGLLEDSLSHVEFFGKKGKSIQVVQRDIYSGAKIEIYQRKEGLFFDEMPFSFGPIAVRTKDFYALFSFSSSVSLEFVEEEGDFLYVDGRSSGATMSGFIGGCLYDEMFEVTEVVKYGRKK